MVWKNQALQALARKIELVHIQPGKPTQNGIVESFNGKFREECLRIHWFQNLYEARRILASWRRDYNERRPHSSLNYLTPAEFAAKNSGGKDADFVHLENAVGVSHFTTAAAAGSLNLDVCGYWGQVNRIHAYCTEVQLQPRRGY